MTAADLIEVLEYNRTRTLGLLDEVAKLPDPAAALAYRPGPGRAPLGWQLMHLGATDDRHVHQRMGRGELREPDYFRRFGFGSTPDDAAVSPDEIRRYLTERRAGALALARTVTDAALDTKPHADAPWTYREWLKILAWHEAHHQGQAHLTLNLYKATQRQPG